MTTELNNAELIAEIEYQLIEARAVVSAKSREAEEIASRDHRRFVNYPQYEMGYVAALEAMLAKISPAEDDEPEVEEYPEDADLEERLRES
jgi:hypothetical protein